ncbi:sulfate adenylyltransferase subunit CysN [Amphritea sp. 1_MG-2023]|uniref:sulfate adenylyltransferase subunit CysN n=1 Tax=Amphritea sp. 1_MG-2023 TaxID=3062670 RepID=UPI0026E1565A|nr:sulfate adenylyltransferase subunit CysN [Amphritea sp. 1_MG-2023]MDO6565148.1 sulfate adenylyltransferase subunit CysN [Amphritea sp. 1_MG-2023]
MAHSSEMISDDIVQYLKDHEQKSLLRFITCGSVDDGKSTLIGRLLFESKLLFEDQLAAVEAESKKFGTQGDNIDFALLVDGLAAEREQGITIDVAYRFFSTDKRKFIVADTPGHEQYTRNMVTGASTADVAILMVDARRGILTQTRRHSYLASLIGIPHIVVAINKMDLVDYSEKTYNQIREDYLEFAKQIGIENITFIPMSALAGDNITEPSNNMTWYHGTTLMGYLETVQVDDELMQKAPFRMAVQWVNRPNLDFRGFAGQLASGVVKPGDRIRALPSGKESTIATISTYDGDLPQAVAGQSVTLTLNDEIDISRGDMITSASEPASIGKQFETTIIWMHEEPLMPGRTYLMQIGTKTVTASITDIKHQVNVNTMEHLAAKKLDLNGIGECNISLDQDIAFDSYKANRDTGSFILIDRMTNNTVGAGLINFALRRSTNITVQHTEVNKAVRSTLKSQKPCVIWLTGLSGSGKSTIADLVEQKLLASGHHTYLLDGDNVRHGLNNDLGFTDQDRVENIRRIAEVAKLMVDAGLIVLTSFISPFQAERKMARDMLDEGEFIEIYVNTPLEVAEDRDVKGLYKKARRGELKNFTGIDSPYEAPEQPDLNLKTLEMTPEEAADKVIELLKQKAMI